MGLINPKMDTAGVWDVMMKQFEHCTMPVLSFAKKLGGLYKFVLVLSAKCVIFFF